MTSNCFMVGNLPVDLFPTSGFFFLIETCAYDRLEELFLVRADGIHCAKLALWLRHFRTAPACAEEEPVHGSRAPAGKGDNLPSGPIRCITYRPILSAGDTILPIDQFIFQFLIGNLNHSSSQTGTHQMIVNYRRHLLIPLVMGRRTQGAG